MDRWLSNGRGKTLTAEGYVGNTGKMKIFYIMIVVVVTQITYLSKLNKLYFKMSEFYFIKLYFKKDALLKKILKHIVL